MTSRYVTERHWPSIPHGLGFCGDANAVAVDSRDNVFVFNRGPLPVMIFDRSGSYLGGWGEGEFDRPHGIMITDDDMVWLVDAGGNFVQKRDTAGRLLLTIGERGKAAPAYSGEPFNAPTDVAIHPQTGEIFVSDGYGNSHIHKFDPAGNHIKSWGGIGDGPGEFTNPHGLCLFGSDTLVVCDRENFRLQFFNLEGEFLDEWHSHNPSAVRSRAGDPNLYLAQLGPYIYYLRGASTKLGNCVQVLSPSGEVLERLGGSGELVAAHGIAVDSAGSIYVAEVSKSFLEFTGQLTVVGTEPVSLHKWAVSSASDPAPSIQAGPQDQQGSPGPCADG